MKVFLLLSLLYCVNFAQNYFPYQMGDSLFYQISSGGSGNYTTSYRLTAIDSSLYIDGRNYIFFNKAYYFQDTESNRLLLRKNPSSEDLILDYTSVDTVEFYGSSYFRNFTVSHSTRTDFGITFPVIELDYYNHVTYSGGGMSTTTNTEYLADGLGVYEQYNTSAESNSLGDFFSSYHSELKQFKLHNSSHTENFITLLTTEEYLPDTLNLATLDSLYFSFATSTTNPGFFRYKYAKIVHKKAGGEVIDTTICNQSYTHNYASLPILQNYEQGDVIQVALIVRDIGLAPVQRLPASGYHNITLIDSIYTSIEDESFAPFNYNLTQNYPNPFNPSTKITYSVAKPGNVKLTVYNSLGQQVKELVNEYKNMGTYLTEFTAEGLPSGLYFYTISSGSFTKTKKMILLK